MNAVFCVMLLGGVLASIAHGNASGVQAALLSGGKEAIELCLSLAGAYAFFGGLMGVLRESGITTEWAARLHRPLMRLFPFLPGEELALPDICVNLSADMLGMGGAATTAGLSAMRIMAQAGKNGEASDAMILFLVMNMCSVQLLPATMIALRAQAGAENPADIVFPALMVTGISCLTGIVICKCLMRRSKVYG